MGKPKTIKIACSGSDSLLVSEFKPLQGDLKAMSPENMEKLKARIVKYGFDAPIFIWDNYVLDGHQRLSAIQSLMDDGYELPGLELPVCKIKAKNMDDAKKRLMGYVSQFGHITAEGLEVFVEGLNLSEIMQEIDLPGYELTAPVPEGGDDINDANPRIDEAEALQQMWLVNNGDVWLCGKHRILCGDSTLPETYAALMEGALANMALTDPPYNVDFHQFLLDAFGNLAKNIKPGASFYCFHSDVEVVNFRTALAKSGLTPRQGLVWNKSQLIPGRQDYQWKHEPILYGWKDGAAHFWNSDRTQTTVLEFSKPLQNNQHPTMKPVDLLCYLIKNSSRESDIVIDPFLGSGSSMVACENTGRVCYGIELSPKYVAVTLQRYFDLTGDKPRRLNES